MELTFEHVQTICAGEQPCVIHTPANIAQVIFVGDGGKVYTTNTPTPYGEFGSRVFEAPFQICKDVDVEYLKLKFVHSSLMAVWKNAAEVDEVIPYVEGVVHSLRHRFALWSVQQNFTNYLVDGSLELAYDDPIARLSMTFENPSYIMSHEEDTVLMPGSKILLFFQAGSSEITVMGQYYIDKNDMAVGDATTSIECRNTIGKLLKDQTFDTDNNYPLQNLKDLATDIFTKANVLNFWVGETAETRGMLFPQSMNLFDGFKELNQTILPWALKETFDGFVGFGDRTDARFGIVSTYYFTRNGDIFSRSVARDDQDTYAKVCVHNDDYSIAEYRDVDFQFVLGSKKTLYVSVAKETLLADAQVYATTLAGMMGQMGTIETFDGPFRPFLHPGDGARIFGPTTRTLGMITSVRHKFGKSGFGTEFTVDSGGMANRTRVSDYINRITGTQTGGQATRLY